MQLPGFCQATTVQGPKKSDTRYAYWNTFVVDDGRLLKLKWAVQENLVRARDFDTSGNGRWGRTSCLARRSLICYEIRFDQIGFDECGYCQKDSSRGLLGRNMHGV